MKIIFLLLVSVAVVGGLYYFNANSQSIIRQTTEVDKPVTDLTYINQLPKINEDAYIAAHKEWDTGMTDKMINGSFVVQAVYLDIAVELADKYYPPNTFGGNTREHFESETNNALSNFRELRDNPSAERGMLDTITASSDGMDYLEARIKTMVKQVASKNDTLNYDEWETKWKKAKGNPE